MICRLAMLILLVGITAVARGADLASYPGVNELPENKELPDPFLFRSGSRVTNAEDWNLRRHELKDLIQEYEYGHLPENPDSVTVMRPKLESLLRSSTLTIQIRDGEKQAVLPVSVTLPPGNGPFAAVITSKIRRPELRELVLGRGYALAEVNLPDIAADGAGRTGAFYTLYPESDAGVLMAWAWGFHRAIDALATVKQVDPAKIIVTGHSRVGKAALVAGAFDERIALTAPNASGLAGAGNFRILHGDCEKIENITGFAPYWFSPRLREFVGRTDRLPFDQHSVMALVAPRALLTTNGTEDAWCNPQGSQTSHEAARVVYRFLGAPDKIGIHYRRGGHDHNAEDWTALLDFADQTLQGKTVQRRFDQFPYPSNPTAMSWAARR